MQALTAKIQIADRSEADRRWDELLASTTEEELARLKRILEQEDLEDDISLDVILKPTSEGKQDDS